MPSNNRAIVLHPGGQCRWAGGKNRWLIRAQQPCRKTLSCKGQPVIRWPPSGISLNPSIGSASRAGARLHCLYALFACVTGRDCCSLCWADGSTHTESNKQTIPQGQTSIPPKSFSTPAAKARPDKAALATSAEERGATHRARPRSPDPDRRKSLCNG